MAELYSPDQALKLALDHFHAGRFIEAEHIFRQLTTVVEKHEFLSYCYGLSCGYLGKLSEAEVWLRKVLTINPTNANAHVDLGRILFMSGHVAEAEETFRNAVCIDPGLLVGWEALKQIAASRGDWRAVMRSLERITALSAGGNYLELTFLAIAGLANNGSISALAILDEMREGAWSRPEVYQLCNPFLQGDISVDDRKGLIDIFNRRIKELYLDGWDCLHLALLWRHLFDMGWYSNAQQLAPVCWPEHVERVIFSSGSIRIFDCILRYKLNSPREWNKKLFEEYLIPLVKKCQESEIYWALADVDELNGSVFAQQPHTEQQAKYCYEVSNAYYAAAGTQLRKQEKPREIPPTQLPVIAFHSKSTINISSPDRVIVQILKGWHKSLHKAFVPLVVGFSGVSKEAREFLDACGVKCLNILDLSDKEAGDSGIEMRLQMLHEKLEQLKVTALVDYGGSDGFSSLIAASRMAPVRVYYSMGYHYINGSDYDAFFCIGSIGEASRIYEGRKWRVAPLSHEDPRSLPNAQEKIDAGCSIREKRFPRQVVLGAIARPQKLDNDEFLSLLAKILDQNDSAVFLWFGKEELATVRQKMIGLGISERCLFEGYQDTSIYAQVLDIHLDPFPFPSGLSVLDTMCYGVPSVFMSTESTMRTGVPSHIFPILNRECGTKEQQDMMHNIFTDPDTGEILAMLATTMDEYAAMTKRLIEDKTFRKKVGHASQRFMQTFMLDPTICYESFSRQILEVIEEKRAAIRLERLVS